MPESSRLQVKTSADPVSWEDVGAGAVGVPVPVAVESAELPTGAATSIKQLPDGHEVEVNNLPATYPLPTTQVTTLTPPAAISGFATSALQLPDGHEVKVNNGALVGSGDPTIDSYTHLSINLSAGNDQVLVASAASKQIWVYGIGFTLSVSGTVSFQDEDNTAITGIMPFYTNSGLGIPPSGNFAMPIWKLATNKDLEVDLVTASMDGWLDYAIVSV